MSDPFKESVFSCQNVDQAADINPTEIRLAAMNLLARREQSRRELQQKLAERFCDPELVERQLQILENEGLQSDQRFAESFLRQRISRGKGPLRIRQEMRHHGLSGEEIGAVLEREAPDWIALAERTYRRKFGDMPPADVKDKARRHRFMQYRGFALEHFQHLFL